MTNDCKVCTQCNVPKGKDEFHKAARYAGGLYPQCKTCVSKYRSNRSVDSPTVLNKKCAGCGDTKPSSEFNKHKNSRDGLAGKCKECTKEYLHAWRTGGGNEKKKQYALSVKKQAIDGYGGKCACCGETELSFLVLDHINNGGNRHRKDLFGTKCGGGYRMYAWAIKNGFPDSLQVLCWNCNGSKSINNGICAHQMGKETDAPRKSA